MANTLRYNNTIPNNIYYGGSTVQNVYYNNTKVWSASRPFAFTYTGAYETEGNLEGNFIIRFKTSGTLTITSHGNNTNGSYDLFAVGGGGGGGWYYDGGQGIQVYGGGGGGYTSTKLGVSLSGGSYLITVGAGGAYNKDGETSSFSSYLSAAGGKTAKGSGNYYYIPHDGGNGGSGGGKASGDGGSDGSDAPTSSGGWTGIAGKGQGSTTREFGESTGVLYAGGGAGANVYVTTTSRPTTGGAGGGGNGMYLYRVSTGTGWAFTNPTPGVANTGGGGGGGAWYLYDKTTYGAAGGSGIVCIRNHR